MNFDELVFNTPTGLGGRQSKVFFENGYGASVVGGGGSYGNGVDTFEVAVLKGSQTKYNLCYTTPVTDDVFTYQNKDQVTAIIIQIKALENKDYNFEHDTDSNATIERVFNACESFKFLTNGSTI